jgi:hypothetical protein
MDWMNLFLNALNVYLAVWIAKSILVLADVHVAAAVTHRITGRPTWVLSRPCKIHLITLTNRKFSIVELNRECSPLSSVISASKTGRKKAAFRPRRTMARSNQRRL